MLWLLLSVPSLSCEISSGSADSRFACVELAAATNDGDVVDAMLASGPARDSAAVTLLEVGRCAGKCAGRYVGGALVGVASVMLPRATLSSVGVLPGEMSMSTSCRSMTVAKQTDILEINCTVAKENRQILQINLKSLHTNSYINMIIV